MVTRILVALAMLGGMAAMPASAHAGVKWKNVDIIQVSPYVGAEYAHVGFGGLTEGPTGPTLVAGDFSSTGLAYGGVVGLRLAPISVGLLLQRSKATDPSGTSLEMNKIYGQFGVNAQYGPVLMLVHFDFGYAYLGVGKDSVQGFGGKIGLALDVYPASWISVGAGADFDAQGYSAPKGLIGSFGGTFSFRLGLHL